ncbi:MAG: 3'(2'),5'-bisphosphate nucleotidase CysQ [Chitinophagales bacterium]|nr:3'(2'),5'-bisphosphate nucleotidase CysQ [Chitinophagales bacterium]
MSFQLQDLDIEFLIQISIEAGNAIMKVYDREFKIETKDDKSPLTEADLLSNEIITKALKKKYLQIPIISEENKLIDFSVRKSWDWCWLVDPIDGTKEFIKRNGEFTVNIALVHQQEVVAGVVYVPAQEKVFYAIKGQGAFLKEDSKDIKQLKIRKIAEDGILRVVASRSHKSAAVDDYVKGIEKKYHNIDFVAAGSSLKFCLLAEGQADVYPRLAPTMEWDTAAGHIVAKEAGAVIIDNETQEELKYNKENLLNPFFVVKHPEFEF